MQPPDASPSAGSAYELKLYVAGQTPKSLAAISNLREICETHLAGRYTVTVIDLLENTERSIVRRLNPDERKNWLYKKYPQLI